MPLINTWDVLLYAPVTMLLGFLIWLENRRSEDEGTSGETVTTDADPANPNGGFICRPYSFILLVPFFSLLVYLPYYLQLNTGGIQGIGLVHTPSPVTAFLLVHGLFLLIHLAYLRKDIIRMPPVLLTPVPFILAGYTAAGAAALPLAYFLIKKKKNPAELLAIPFRISNCILG